MQNIDTLISARWVLPIAPDNVVLENHSLAIADDKIVGLLPTSQALQQYAPKLHHELNNHALLPGLVNAHAHTPMNLFRGLADDLELMDWLQNYIWPAEQDIVNAESVSDGTHFAMLEMLRGGITCFNDHYFFPNEIAKAAIGAGLRASVGLVIMSVPTQWAQNEDDYFKKALDTLDSPSNNSLIHWTLAPHAPYTVSDDSLRRVKQLSEERNLQIHMHVHETQTELQTDLDNHGKRPLQRLHDLGLLSDRFIAVHMVHLNDAEIDLLRQTGTHVVHCPESNLKLASGFAPIQKLLDKNINVAVGTDGAASNNDLDLFGELQTAAMLAKAQSGNPTALPAAEAIKMATLNGAKALGLDKEIGSLEKGKAADCIAVDLDHYFTQPVYNPMSTLAYAVNRQQVSDVWVAGKQLLRHGEFTQLDRTAIVNKAKTWFKKAETFKSQGSTMQTSVAASS